MVSRRAVLVGLISTGFISAGCVNRESENSSSPGGERGNRDQSTGLGYSSSSGCFEEIHRDHSGWIYSGNSEVSFNVVFRHSRATSIKPRIKSEGAGNYRINISIESQNPASSEESGGNCPRGTKIEGGAALPTDHEKIEFAVNSDVLVSIKRRDTTPEVRTLPNPIER